MVELDEEGLLIQKKSYLMDRMRRDTLLHVSKEFCWGSHQKGPLQVQIQILRIAVMR